MGMRALTSGYVFIRFYKVWHAVNNFTVAVGEAQFEHSHQLLDNRPV